MKLCSSGHMPLPMRVIIFSDLMETERNIGVGRLLFHSCFALKLFGELLENEAFRISYIIKFLASI